MKQVNIGKSGMLGSEIALGCMRISGIEEKTLDMYIHAAVEMGVNYFDHADIYGGGECETVFGKVLAKDKTLRENMLLQSKCGIRKDMYDFSKSHILSSVDGSLKRLNTEYLDVLILHRPDTLMEPEEISEAFNQLETSGKVKQFGVSNFNPMQIELLQSGLKQKLIANQMQFSIKHTNMIDSGICANTKFDGSIDRDGSVLEYCRLKNITIQAWSPFQYGFFEGVFIDCEKFPELNTKLQEIAEKYNTTKTAVSTAWILRHPAHMQVIAGTTNLQRLEEICSACEIGLTRKDWYEIYLAAGNILP